MTAAAPSTRPSGARTAAAPATRAPSRLHLAKRGLIHEPLRYFFYGPPAVGKSSLAADAPEPIFLDADRGSGRLDVTRYPFRDGDDGHLLLSLAELYAAVDDLIANEHGYRTVVIDTADAVEALLWKHVIDHAPVGREGKPTSIESFGYGRGYQLAVDEWRVLLHRLDMLRLRRSVDIVFLSHSLVKTFKNPLGEDFDRYQPKLDHRATGLIHGWCDVVGFVCFEEGGAKATAKDRARGWSTGRRLIRLEHNAAWDAKSRIGMPPEIDLGFEHPWAPFAAAVEQSRSMGPADVVALIEAELARLGDEFVKADGSPSTAAAVRRALEGVDSVSTLGKFLNGLKQAQPKQEVQS